MKPLVTLAVLAIPCLALAAPAVKPAKPAKPAASAKPAAAKPGAKPAAPEKPAPAPAPAPASAGSKLPLGTQHSPPVIMDEASASISIGTQSDGYSISAYVEITGIGSKTDRAYINWKQGGKLLQTVKCPLNINGKYATAVCEYRDTATKAKGDIEAELIYFDDQTEKEYLLRTFKVKVYYFKGQWETWQIFPDDVLASAYAYMGHENYEDSTYRHPNFYIWFSTGDYLGGGNLRCTVNGTKKLADIELGTEGGPDAGTIEADVMPSGGERVTYRWQKMDLMPEQMMWGKRSTLKWDMAKTAAKDSVLSDNPGKWDCFIRKDGKAIRELLFTVDADGMILPAEFQSGSGAIPMVSTRVVPIEIRLTKDSQSFDKRINPDAMKKSMGFGLPWPNHPSVKATQASYPPKFGQPDPK